MSNLIAQRAALTQGIAAAPAAAAATGAAPAAAGATPAAVTESTPGIIRRGLGALNRFGGTTLTGAGLMLHSPDVGAGSDLPGTESTPTRKQIEDLFQNGQITPEQRTGLYDKYITAKTTPNAWEDVISMGEHQAPTGKVFGRAVPDAGGTYSYGWAGLNSKGGRDSTMAQFANDHPELNLKGNPGAPAFNKNWENVVRDNPQAVAAAQKDFVEKKFYAPTQKALTSILPLEATKDPRIAAYFTDRGVHLGADSTRRDSAAITKAFKDSKGDTNKFFSNMNAYDWEHRKEQFPTAYGDGTMTDKGFKLRSDTRTQGALNVGAKNAAPTPNRPSEAPPTPPRVPASVTEKIRSLVAPEATGKQATADTLPNPNTGNVELVHPNTNIPIDTDKPVAKPAVAPVVAPNNDAMKNDAANAALAKAKEASARGDKANADKYFNIGMALMASGAGTLAGGSPFAMQNIGKGVGQGIGTYAELSKQDKAEKLRRQQLAETSRKDYAQEARGILQLHQTDMIARARQMIPDFDTNPEKANAASQYQTAKFALDNLSPEHRAAMYGDNADVMLTKAMKSAEAILGGATAGAGGVKKYNPATGKIE